MKRYNGFSHASILPLWAGSARGLRNYLLFKVHNYNFSVLALLRGRLKRDFHQ